MVVGFRMSIDYVVERSAWGVAWSFREIQFSHRSYHNPKPNSPPPQYFNPDDSIAQLILVETFFTIVNTFVVPPAPPKGLRNPHNR